MLGKNHIDNDQQLFLYKNSVQKEIKALTSDRTHLRKKIRTKLSESELSEAKAEISEITEKLRTLRKEVNMCDHIAERSKVIKTKLEVIKSDEEKFKRKEQRDYE